MKWQSNYHSRLAGQVVRLTNCSGKVTPRALAHLSCRVCLWAALWLAGLGFVGHPAQAAVVTEAWVHRYNNPLSDSTDQAIKVVRDAAGDIIVTGDTDDGITGSDMLTIKYSGADASVLWQRRYNSPADYHDHAGAVAVDGSGNVVVTGSSHNRPPNYDADYYTAKYAAADGALLWEQRYNGPANSVDRAQAVTVDGSGNVVVTGFSYNSSFSSDYYTAKYAATNGALLWEKRYNGPANGTDQARAVAVDGDGNVVVAGYSAAFGYADYYTAKYAAANGALLWEKRYNGPGNDLDYAEAVAVDRSGNVVVTGFSVGSGGGADYYTAKYAAADGALLWEKRYNGPANSEDRAQAVTVDINGNAVVTGYSASASSADYYTAKYAAADGALLWEKRYNGPANNDDQAQAVAVDGSGNAVVTGYSSGSGSAYDYYTAKYAATNGALLWEKRYTGPANSVDYAQAVGVDGSGNVVVTGSSYNSSFSSDYYTAKYAAANGALLWERRYNGPANSYDDAQAVAVDGNGNAVVTGYSYGGGSLADYYTAKYAAANGALLWEKRYNGPANSEDRAQAVTVDGSGNVVVTGSSYNSNFSSDYYTAKYAAANGALLWSKRYNGPANSDDQAQAVVVDGSGNVVVTGSSYNSNFSSDYYTAKYAAANGALLWEKRYNGPANAGDQAQAVAVDGGGNVVVTGYSYNTSGNTDYYTAKYAAANGALLWEKPYNGPANLEDIAQAVAVDSSGNVVVTGSSIGSGGNHDYYTAKYAAANGALLWEQRYDGPANSDDRARAVAADGSGNVLVSGSSVGSGGSPDYYTAKYAAADGALLWEERYNGPANGEDSVASSRSLAIGPNGMVAITGSSDFSSGLVYSPDYATVLYRQNLPPVITCPTNTVANCSEGGAVVNFMVTATDDSGLPPTITCAPASGSMFPFGETIVSCTARDGDSLSSTCRFTVTVVDRTPPVIACSSNQVLECTSPAGALATFAATATDACDANPVVVCSPASGSTLPLGSTVVTCTATDANTNSSSCTFTVTLVDTTPPVIVCNSNLVLECATPAGALATFAATAIDACDANPVVVCSPPSGNTFPHGSTTATCTAADANTNSSSCTFTVTVVDTTPPDITCPSNITVEFTSEAGAVVTYSVTAADFCDPAPVVTCVPPSGSTFPIGATEVHCTARDASGNSNSCSFAVTVLGARGVKENVLAELMALRATVTDQEDGKKFDEAIEHLSKSLAAELWVDQTHLQRKHGDKVFHEEKETVKKLCDLIKSNQSNIPDAVLQGFVDRIFRADRFLASVAIQEAIAAGASRKKIEQAQKHLATGDARVEDDKCDNGVEDYRNAWKHAVRAKVSPPTHLTNGQMQLEILGVPGERFTIQASSDLADWVTIGAGTANAEGVVTFEDADAGQYPARYYRAVSQ